MRDLLWFIGMLSLVVVLVATVGRLEYLDGFAAGQSSVKVTDKQCAAWLFESNMKDVKRRICK